MSAARVRVPWALAVAIVAACGGSKGGDQGGQDAGSAAEASAGDDAGAQAGDDAGPSSDAPAPPPDDGPWPAGHYPMPQFTNMGGPVVASPKLIPVTFVGNTRRDAIRTFMTQFVADTDWWTAISSGWGVGTPSLGTAIELPDTVSGQTIDDTAQLKPMLQNLVSTGALPPPDANTIYTLFFPASTTISLPNYGSSCQAFGAYHDSVSIPANGTAQAAYAVIPDCPTAPAADEPMTTTTQDVSHEIAEAVTDPQPQVKPGWYGFNDAWFRTFGSPQGQGQGQGEVADVCQRYQPVTDASGNELVRAWVDTAAAASHNPCQPSLPGTIFYSLAVPTQTLVSSDGYILVKKGTTKTVDAVFFSDAKLPSDAQLTIGARAHGTLNPAIGTGITASLSLASAHNGMHVTVTLAVDASAASKDYAVTARAALSTTDYHDWPFILHVP
jgi:hypothetical protein